jgi:hypothetical protein
MAIQKEFPPNAELERLTSILIQRFIQRLDIYPKQLPNGSYVTIHEPLHPGLVLAHLKGELTLGAYLLNAESEARFLVLDSDTDTSWEMLRIIAPQLLTQGVPTYLEPSRRGGHLWFIFARQIPGREVRQFAHGIVHTYDLEGIEIYPKQDTLITGPGSLIRLPFGVHQRNRRRYTFYRSGQAHTVRLAPSITTQIQHFLRPSIVPETAFLKFRDIGAIEPQERRKKASESVKGAARTRLPDDAPVSERIKAATTVGEFVNHYVELSERGQGLCPFHDDHAASFSVHTEDNFWYCFTCDMGGSVIDFWMQYRRIDFATAVRELAKTLL